MKFIIAIAFIVATIFSLSPATAADRTVVSATALDTNWDGQCVQFAAANDGTVWCAHTTTYAGHDWMFGDGSVLALVGSDITWIQMPAMPSGRASASVVGSMYSASLSMSVLVTAVATDGTAWNLIPDDRCYYCSHATNTLHWYLALPALPPSE
jgi:hypothetical protein